VQRRACCLSRRNSVSCYAQDGPRCTFPSCRLGCSPGRCTCWSPSHAGACRWVKEKERCLENEAKIMKDVRLPLPHTVLRVGVFLFNFSADARGAGLLCVRGNVVLLRCTPMCVEA
jgi:hypothetical protein